MTPAALAWLAAMFIGCRRPGTMAQLSQLQQLPLVNLGVRPPTAGNQDDTRPCTESKPSMGGTFSSLVGREQGERTSWKYPAKSKDSQRHKAEKPPQGVGASTFSLCSTRKWEVLAMALGHSGKLKWFCWEALLMTCFRKDSSSQN